MSFLPQGPDALLSLVSSQLSRFPHLYSSLTVSQLWTYINTITRFIPLILLSSPRTTIGLPVLNANIRQTLTIVMRLPPQHVEDLWTAMGPVLLLYRGMNINVGDIDRSLAQNAPAHQLGTNLTFALQRRC